MLIQIRTFGLTLSEVLREHVESSLMSAARPFGRAVSSITARLTDINAGRGGKDKQCRLVAVLPHQGQIVAEGLHSDPYASIDQASNRMRRALSRALTRQTWRERQRPRHVQAG